jgi:hypothetical protein
MAEQKGKGRRAYLNHFKRNLDGLYEYEGDYYCFEGTEASYQKALVRLWIWCVLALAVIIGAGCISVPGMSNSFYVLLPYTGSVVAAIRVCWAVARMTAQKQPGKDAAEILLKEYVYEGSAKIFSFWSILTAVCAVICLAGESFYVLQNGTAGKTGAIVLFLFLMAVAAVFSVLFYRFSTKMKWKKKEIPRNTRKKKEKESGKSCQ